MSWFGKTITFVTTRNNHRGGAGDQFGGGTTLGTEVSGLWCHRAAIWAHCPEGGV